MRNHKLKALSIAVLLLSGCSNTGSPNSSGAPQTSEEATIIENPVRLDQLGVLPASDSSAASYLLQLTNYGKEKYTLESVRAIDLTTGKDSTLVSVASQACSIVSANGSCSIQLTPHTNKSAEAKLEVKVKAPSGEIKTLVQLIRISGKLSSNNGGIVMLNDVDRIITEDGNYSLAIPVVLGDNYDDIKASNGTILCNESGYLKGNSCTYLVHGKTSGDTVVATRLEGIKSGKIVTTQEANTKLYIGKGAHLLLSHGTTIAHPTTSETISVFNNGNIAATDIKASLTDANLQLSDSKAIPCANTLGEGDTCKIQVNVKGTVNGQAPVTLTYNDDKTQYKAISNVSYTVEDASVGMSFDEESSNLNSAIVGGKIRTAAVEIKNTGNRNLEKMNYYLAPAGNAAMKLSSPAQNGCKLDGNATLTPKQSCLVTVEYHPTKATQANETINLVANAKYMDHNGQPHSLLQSHGLTYSAEEVSNTSLSWQKQTSSPNDLVISTLNQDSKQAVWDLKSTLASDEGLAATLTGNVTLSKAITSLKVVPVNATTCGSNAVIASGGLCSYKVSFGPTNTEILDEAHLQANYTLNNKKLSSDSAKFKVQASSGPSPKINTTVTIVNSPQSLTGDGSTVTPWKFTALNNNTLALKYTFENKGTAEATKFNVNAGLPNGISVIGGDCPIGTGVGNLSVNQSCTLDVAIPDPKLFARPNLNSDQLNNAQLIFSLPYSYSAGNKTIQSDGSDTLRAVQFSRLWAGVTHKTDSYEENSKGHEFKVISRVTIPTNKLGISYPVTVTPTMKNPVTGATYKACQIPQGQDSCINEIILPKDQFIAGQSLYVTFTTTAQGVANGGDVIISDHEIKADTNRVYTETGLINALQNPPAGSIITLEKDIVLTKPWIPIESLSNVTLDAQGHKITNIQVTNGSDKTTPRVGMFRYIGNYVTIKNLALEGKVVSTVDKTGLLAGSLYGSHIKIINSHFKADIIGTTNAGGLLGDMRMSNQDVVIESVTVISKVQGTTAVGGLFGDDTAILNVSNSRIKSEVTGTLHIGGVSGFNTRQFDVEDTLMNLKNIIIDTKVTARSENVVGVSGLTEAYSTVSNLEGVINLDVKNATWAGGLFARAENFSKVNNILLKGIIKSSRNNIDNIATFAPSGYGVALMQNFIDLVTINMNNMSYIRTFDSPSGFLSSSKNVFYMPPNANQQLLTPSASFYAPLQGDTAAKMKDFLEPLGFDFTNTWTIKKVNGVDTIGIKEDSIPQFPNWN